VFSMPEPRYHIIFSALVEGRQPERVYHDLADLFKIEEDMVQRIFACQGAVVKSGLDRAAAEQYVQVILAAGAICVIESMPPIPKDTSNAGTHPSAAHDLPSPPEPAAHVPTDCRRNNADETDHHADSAQGMDATAGSDVSERSGMVRAPALAALLLLAGACFPLMSGSGELYWPWHYAFEPQPPGLLWWATVPALAAGLIVLLRAPVFSLIVSITGVGVLLAIVVILWEASLIIPLRILPLDRPAALLVVMPLAGAAVCSAACGAMEDLGELLLLRLLAAGGSLAVLIPAFTALFSTGSIWHRWPLILLLLTMLLYAVAALVCAFVPSVPETLLYQVRLLRGFLVCWAPAAVFLAHLPPAAPDTVVMLVIATLKAGLLYYGALSAIAGGLHNEFIYRFEK